MIDHQRLGSHMLPGFQLAQLETCWFQLLTTLPSRQVAWKNTLWFREVSDSCCYPMSKWGALHGIMHHLLTKIALLRVRSSFKCGLEYIGSPVLRLKSLLISPEKWFIFIFDIDLWGICESSADKQQTSRCNSFFFWWTPMFHSTVHPTFLVGWLCMSMKSYEIRWNIVGVHSTLHVSEISICLMLKHPDMAPCLSSD